MIPGHMGHIYGLFAETFLTRIGMKKFRKKASASAPPAPRGESITVPLQEK